VTTILRPVQQAIEGHKGPAGEVMKGNFRVSPSNNRKSTKQDIHGAEVLSKLDADEGF
jgi:hypothetical protein